MIQEILDKAVAGTRITFDEALLLMERADLDALGRAATAVRDRLVSEGVELAAFV